MEFIESFWDNDYDTSGNFDFLDTDERAILQPVIDALTAYDLPDHGNPTQILADPTWLRVTDAAKLATEQLAQHITEPEERRHLTEGARVIDTPGGGQRLE